MCGGLIGDINKINYSTFSRKIIYFTFEQTGVKLTLKNDTYGK
jgi:hypothetical protein